MTSYVIFGAGRVGANMASYLTHLGHQVAVASRAQAETAQSECIRLIEQADIVAVAIPDDKLEPWRDTWRLAIERKTVIHFSGAVSLDGIYGFHPLYSFPKSALSADAMKNILFACPSDGPSFETIFPNAPNPNFEIADADRARYHALAVLAGNLASYVWNETAREFAAISNLPPDKMLKRYLNSIVDRFVENPTASLTGPIARRDKITVARNLAGLSDNAVLKDLYMAFLTSAWPDYQPSDDAE